MTVSNTTLLGLVQPTTGSESGVWGDDVNYGLTSIVDVSVAGTNNITQTTDITLVVTNGNNTTTSTFPATATNSTVAQYAILNCTGSRPGNTNIIAPATSKMFLITNATTGGYSITIKKFGGTGVTIANGETALVYYNITGATPDYARATSFSTATAGAVPYGTSSGGIAFTAAGTTGQALLSNGSSAPTWGTAGVSTGKAIAMAMIFGF